MAALSVGSFSMDADDWLRGFSFTPNVPGPNGSGGPGTATSVTVNSVIVGCPSAAAAGEASTCYLYSEELDSPDEIGESDGLVATSSSSAVGSAFGSGSYSTTYSFSGATLDPTKQYFAYFSANRNTCVDTNDPYTGGTAYDVFMDDDGTSPQFQVNMST